MEHWIGKEAKGKRRKTTGRNWNHSDIEIINNLYETVYKYKRR